MQVDGKAGLDAPRIFPYAIVSQEDIASLPLRRPEDDSKKDQAALLETIRNSIIGRDQMIDTPFGQKRLVTYADYTASGRSLSFIEDYLRHEVLPMYSNTHTVSSSLGRQMTAFRAEARSIVGRMVHASKDDVVLFSGSGSTGALMLLIHLLGLKEGEPATDGTPVVLIGPYEHHSNILPWREAGAEVVEVNEAAQGGVDMNHLAALTEKYNSRAVKIGSFSAASNVTGILTDTRAVTVALHKHGFFAFFDYASAAPYVKVDMNPSGGGAGGQSNFSKDAIVMSPHKFVGGPGTPGVLVIKRKFLGRRVPSSPGGGTVFFVSSESHRYLQNFEEREEGGTPDVVGAVRCGMVFQLKESVGSELIASRERLFCKKALDAFGANERIVILGQAAAADRLPIFSLMFKHPESGLFLHSTFVSCLLNDLFGIQTRSGCLCAGPYGLKLLGASKLASKFEKELLQNDELSRPGFVRLNFNYFVSEDEVEFVIRAVNFVANHSWKLLPLYSFFVDTGEWKHKNRTKYVDRKWLSHISYSGGKIAFKKTNEWTYTSSVSSSDKASLYNKYLEEADKHIKQAVDSCSTSMVDQSMFLKDGAKELRWFLLPSEALAFILQKPLGYDIPVSVINPPSSLCFSTSVPSSVASSSQSPGSSSLVEASVSRQPSEAARATNTPMCNIQPFKKKQSKPKPEVVPRKGKANRQKPQRREAQLPDNRKESKTCRNCFHDHFTSSNEFQGSCEANVQHASAKRCLSCECVNFVPQRIVSEKAVTHLRRKLCKQVTAASKDYKMIGPGDRVLIGISGGKDSLSLVHILLEIQRRAPFQFDIGCVTVDPQTPEYDPSPLIPYFAALGIPYFYESQGVLKLAETCMNSKRISICSFCSRMKRGILYSACRREGYNVLALGQHLDDLAESFLMSVFHNGCLRTMKANYHAEAGDLRIIRPLIYVRERMLREYAMIADLPVINENCPACFEAPKERARVKLVLAEQEHRHPSVFQSMLKSMAPLMALENSFIKANPFNGREEDADAVNPFVDSSNPDRSLYKARVKLVSPTKKQRKANRNAYQPISSIPSLLLLRSKLCPWLSP